MPLPTLRTAMWSVGVTAQGPAAHCVTVPALRRLIEEVGGSRKNGSPTTESTPMSPGCITAGNCHSTNGWATAVEAAMAAIATIRCLIEILREGPRVAAHGALTSTRRAAPNLLTIRACPDRLSAFPVAPAQQAMRFGNARCCSRPFGALAVQLIILAKAAGCH